MTHGDRLPRGPLAASSPGANGHHPAWLTEARRGRLSSGWQSTGSRRPRTRTGATPASGPSWRCRSSRPRPGWVTGCRRARSTRWPPTWAARGWSSSTATSLPSCRRCRAARRRHGDEPRLGARRGSASASNRSSRARSQHSTTPSRRSTPPSPRTGRSSTSRPTRPSTEPIHLLFVSDSRQLLPLLSSPAVGGPGRAPEAGWRSSRPTSASPATCTSPTPSPRSSSPTAPRSSTTRCRTSPTPRSTSALLDVRPGPASRFSSHSVALGSSLARHEVRVRLEAEGAEVILDGLYMARGDQHHRQPDR